jgi:hypothetical protein
MCTLTSSTARPEFEPIRQVRPRVIGHRRLGRLRHRRDRVGGANHDEAIGEASPIQGGDDITVETTGMTPWLVYLTALADEPPQHQTLGRDFAR